MIETSRNIEANYRALVYGFIFSLVKNKEKECLKIVLTLKYLKGNKKISVDRDSFGLIPSYDTELRMHRS